MDTCGPNGTTCEAETRRRGNDGDSHSRATYVQGATVRGETEEEEEEKRERESERAGAGESDRCDGERGGGKSGAREERTRERSAQTK